MQNSDLHQTIAEISIALAGLTGVVEFFGERASGVWRAADLWRFGNLLSLSIAAMLFSLVPILLFEFGTPEPIAWRCAAGLMAAHMAIGGAGIPSEIKPDEY